MAKSSSGYDVFNGYPSSWCMIHKQKSPLYDNIFILQVNIKMKIAFLLNPTYNDVENKPILDYSKYQKQVYHGPSNFDLLGYICKNGYCPECRKTFVSKGAASRHFHCVHSQPLKCPFCPKKIKYLGRQDLLKQHLQRCQENRVITPSQLKLIYLNALKALNINAPRVTVFGFIHNKFT